MFNIILHFSKILKSLPSSLFPLFPSFFYIYNQYFLTIRVNCCCILYCTISIALASSRSRILKSFAFAYNARWNTCRFASETESTVILHLSLFNVLTFMSFSLLFFTLIFIFFSLWVSMSLFFFSITSSLVCSRKKHHDRA